MKNQPDNNLNFDFAEEGENTLVLSPMENGFDTISIDPKDGYRFCKCPGWMPNNPKNDYFKNCGHH